MPVGPNIKVANKTRKGANSNSFAANKKEPPETQFARPVLINSSKPAYASGSADLLRMASSSAAKAASAAAVASAFAFASSAVAVALSAAKEAF
jgi:hypothetical protein